MGGEIFSELIIKLYHILQGIIGFIFAQPMLFLKRWHLIGVLATFRSFVIVHSETIGLLGAERIKYANWHWKQV